MVSRRLVIVYGVAVAGVCGLVAAGSYHAETTRGLQDALAKLHRGQLSQAEADALVLASRSDKSAPRAWLVVASARQRRGKYAAAARAYRNFLANCTSPRLRAYAGEQIVQCTADGSGPAPRRAAPSKRLTAADLAELATVEKQMRTETTEHFVVRARNARLAKLTAIEAEASLRRICGYILCGQAYPHSVAITVWADHKEYADHARDAPEWAGGSFTITSDNGVATRRIDLTQRDADGRFDTIMLDRVLPHEMCHLVVHEFFGDVECPLVLDEGLAMLAECETDNARVMLAGLVLAADREASLDDLFVRPRHTIGDPAVFYAKSFTFIEFLRNRMTPEQFRAFLSYVKGGCGIGDAIQRAICCPDSEQFIPALARAWQDRTVLQAQFLRALADRK